MSSRSSHLIPFAFAAALVCMPAGAGFAAPPAVLAAAAPADPVERLLVELGEAARSRDSLTALADSSSGAGHDFLEELLWKRHLDAHTRLMAVAEELQAKLERGEDVSSDRKRVQAAFRGLWPGYVYQLERRRRQLSALGRTSDAASGSQRLVIEADMTRLSDRVLESYRALVDAVLALERDRIDVTTQRTYLTQGLRDAASGLVARVQVLTRDRATTAAQLARTPASTDLRYALDASEERLRRATLGLSTAIELMDRLGLEDDDLRVALILSSGRITTDVFRWNVAVGLLRAWGGHLAELLAVKAPQWVFQILLVAVTFLAFRWASRAVGRLARRAVRRSQLSELMRATLSRLAVSGVMLVGLGVILTQLGVQLAPLLAGLGIAGFAVGFALQNTLANLAAGALILGTRPYDLGDEIESSGVFGTVKRMSLVSTTILTPDNQTLIVPNSAIWSGVIRNRTAEPLRRVDLSFGVGYDEDVDRVQRVLGEVVTAEEKVLTEPAPVIRLHQLGESTVQFIVRVWTRKERYWEVYWDLTRAVKLRFDQEGIAFPYPQREVTHRVAPGSGGAVETKPGQS
ncbi:MAG TPA: mechanosensitive ion channel family protein [Methylomirabilota bacterium]|jgi:small conductance mechanosensitive channel|nr:mechanosensitive ion channel family protein [Methylomirabilota bacterium]